MAEKKEENKPSEMETKKVTTKKTATKSKTAKQTKTTKKAKKESPLKDKVFVNPDPEPWEMQVGESTPAFEAFTVYRNMENRSVRKVARKLGKSGTLISEWSSKWKWVERAAAWDAEVDRQTRDAQIKAIKEMREKHAKIATSMLTLAVEMMKSVKSELDMMEPKDKASTISKMVDVATKLERVSRGDSGEVVEVKDGGEAITKTVQLYIPDNGRDKGDEDDKDEE